jgi:hypothetical protein
VLPSELDDTHGYGVSVEGLAGAPDTYFHIRQSVIRDATLAGISYLGATGTISGSRVNGSDFAVAWSGWPQPPNDAGDNDLDGDLVDGISHQDLAPIPAPEPVLPNVEE